MQLTPHFSLEEFTFSETAIRQGIDNTLPKDLLPRAIETAQMMERIRAYLTIVKGKDVPIFITSAYRCLRLNRALGSKDTSDHPRMWALDWRAPTFGTPYEVCLALQRAVDQLKIGQLIHEYGRWVHTSSHMVDKPVNRVITYKPGQPHPLVGIHRID